MNAPQKNYLTRSWQAAVALVAVMVGVSFIPPQTVGGVKLRRANILSDLFVFEDDAAIAESAEASPELFDEAEFSIDIQEVQQQITEIDTLPKRAETTFVWNLWPDSLARRTFDRKIDLDTALLSPRLVAIEEPDSVVGHTFAAFCDTLLTARRAVRIAVLGDSFIEGDILTADLREELQRRYGGGGAGFAPTASPLASFRRSVKTQAKGWTSHNIMQRKTAPEPLRSNFYISGWVCQPSAGASTRWEMTDYRPRLDSCTLARLLFISHDESRVEVVVNDSLHREFTVEADPAVRQIVVEAPHIHSLTMKVLSGERGLIGYGAQFEGRGVVVDNYSVRSNNGQAMFWSNPSVNAQINAMTGYDLVVLQYGLNIMQAGVKNYTSYAAQIEKMVAYVRECFPTAAVLVMGVSDRSVKGEGGYAPMDAVPYMSACQRSAAHRAGASFWPTSDAMQAYGGMAAFVRNGWAGKDFTHINYAGGRQVAWALVDAIDSRVAQIRERHGIRERQRRESFMIDSLRDVEIGNQLFPAQEGLGTLKTEW